MLTSIPVSEFVDPVPNSRAYNAIVRAVEENLDIQMIGQIGWERYYRVQRPKRNRHLVVLWTEELSGDPVAKCDCEAHYIPQDPQPCVHIATALVWESRHPEAEPAVGKRTVSLQAEVDARLSDNDATVAAIQFWMNKLFPDKRRANGKGRAPRKEGANAADRSRTGANKVERRNQRRV